MLGARHHTPDNGLDLGPEALLGDFLSQFYLGQAREIPAEVITSHPVPEDELITRR